jgi:hypothetical protein
MNDIGSVWFKDTERFLGIAPLQVTPSRLKTYSRKLAEQGPTT